jgi:hypothetical protein
LLPQHSTWLSEPTTAQAKSAPTAMAVAPVIPATGFGEDIPLVDENVQHCTVPSGSNAQAWGTPAEMALGIWHTPPEHAKHA